MIQREASYAALAARLEDKLGPEWQVTRNYYDWDSPRITQPACIVVSRSQEALEEPQLPPRWLLRASVILYFKNQFPGEDIIDTMANAAIDTIADALRLQPDERGSGLSSHTTLGGLVQHAWIDGQVEIFQGLEGDQAVVMLPISMLAV